MECRCGEQMTILGTLEEMGTAETALVWRCEKCARMLIRWSSLWSSGKGEQWYLTGATDDGRAHATIDLSGLPQPPRREGGRRDG